MANDSIPHYYTLGTAAKATGKSKSTLLDAIRKGKFSYVEKTTEGYKIDPAELHRVYPKIQDERSIESAEVNASTRLKEEIKRFETELYGVQSRLREKDTQLKDVATERDHWRQQATYLIEDRTKKETHVREQEEGFRQMERELRQRIEAEAKERVRVLEQLAAAQERAKELEHQEQLREVAAPKVGVVRRAWRKFW